MPTFTVHAPPQQSSRSADPERFVFVRDGFYFWAFLLTPLWLLLRRLWLVLLAYVVLVIVVAVTLRLLGLPPSVRFAVATLISLLVGFEASTLWRWTLARRGNRFLGLATGDDLEEAERRFFSAWTPHNPSMPAQDTTTQFAAPVRRGPPSASDIIGLFPEPGGRP